MASSPEALLRRFADQLRRTARAPEPDQVHDLRVATRRFSQALAVGIPKSRDADVMRKAMKAVMKLAGNVRDCDITLKLAARSGGSLRLAARLRRRRERAQIKLVDGIGEWMKAHPPKAWKERLPAGYKKSAAARGVVVEKLFKRGDRAEESDRKLHPLRIAAKKLRYTLELGPHEVSRLQSIKELQRRLGDINDFEAARRIAGEEEAPVRLLREMKDKQDRKTRAFRRYWAANFSGRREEWTAALTAR